MATAQATLFSFRLENFAGGGALPEGKYKCKECRFVLWDYDGKAPQTTALRIVAVSNDAAAQEFTQHWSVGDPQKVLPTQDGKGIAVLSGKNTIGKGSNFFIFFESLINAGLPEDALENDFSVLDGMEVQIAQVPAPKRSGLPKSKLDDGPGAAPERDRMIPVISVIDKCLPWIKGTGATAAAKPAKAGKNTAAAVAAPVAQAAKATGNGAEGGLTPYLLEAIGNEKSIPKTQLRVRTFKAMNAAGVSTAERDSLMAVFANDEAFSAVLEESGYILEGSDIKAI
jgi:hypothetical protein